ncbi:Phosphoglucomutase-1 [Clonorchis sinensis]|uniref:phosphoglucomutase (alpha-D-glucose-1,6-bisphosphate-dependent) n=1 Tax=Clonorchis sinensis TaxID=79923 RepID=A0A3R7GK46_CLOSI|nr:Phosphoglucomutase-1 [Clonorchis sinensis]
MLSSSSSSAVKNRILAELTLSLVLTGMCSSLTSATNMSHTQQYEIITKHTTPFTDQKPGTSGLRKPTKTFQQRYYTENFIQATLNAALKNSILGTAPVRLVVGGDGRYFLRECLQQIILPMCAANGVSEVLVGQGGILSTPAASCIIRTYKLHGGILLTASHNPGGPEADFGIKYNCENGGPSPEKVTNAIYEESKSLSEFRTLTNPLDFDLDKIGASEFMLSNKKSFRVNVISSVSDYASYISSLFDFGAIRGLLSGSSGHAPFKLKISGLSGVTGPYIKELLCEKLGMPEECALKAVPLEDFGGGHPDPNLTYAADLVQAVVDDPSVSLAAAFDGDGDRNMIIGRNGFFVSPCDSLAVIADNVDAIKYFRESGISGCARSMPTSRALDRVCEARKIPCFEVPTGWKFFGNLMDANMCSLCGEESFGTGSNHIREKDGMWALFAWLSILASRQQAGKPADVEAILREHWVKYGRYFFTRYDYENCESAQGDAIISKLKELLKQGVKGRVFNTSTGRQFTGDFIDDFSYVDPVDHSETKNQGIRVMFTDGTRFVYRLSGTGSSGATLRMYIDTFEPDPSKHAIHSQVYLKSHIELALQLCGVKEITGRAAPTVIT